MTHIEDAPIVTQKHLVSSVARKPKGKRPLFGGDKRAARLEEPVHDEHGKPAAAVRVLEVRGLRINDAVHAQKVSVLRLDRLVPDLESALCGIVSHVLDELFLAPAFGIIPLLLLATEGAKNLGTAASSRTDSAHTTTSTRKNDESTLAVVWVTTRRAREYSVGRE